MATVPDRGDVPNYDRIDAALKEHQALWQKIDDLATMATCAGKGWRCQLMVEGCDTAPLEITQPQADALIQSSIDDLAKQAMVLGDFLTSVAQTIPAEAPPKPATPKK